MKELSIEGKATRYDQALERARAKYAMKDQPIHQDLVDIFPELKESEDGGIYRKLIAFLKQSKAVYGDSFKQFGLDIDDAIAWLEKQGEQKTVVIIPKFRVGDTIRIKNSNAEYTITEISDGYYRGKGWCLDIAAGDECGDYELVEQEPAWSEEDEDAIGMAIIALEDMYDPDEPNNTYAGYTMPFNKAALRLRVLKERVQPQPKQEWSERDKEEFQIAIDTLVEAGQHDSAHWLKSIKERVQYQPQWKPSNEQLVALRIAIGDEQGSGCCDILRSLLKDLKSL